MKPKTCNNGIMEYGARWRYGDWRWIWNMESGIKICGNGNVEMWQRGIGIWNMEYGIQNIEYGRIQNMEYGIQNMEYRIQNLEYESGVDGKWE
jgi:hypothetical protein